MNESINNLKLLLAHLETNFSRINEHFDMKFYRSDKGKNIAYYNSTDCGTIGCLIGYAPECIPTIEDDYYASGKLHFYKYGNRIFSDIRYQACYFLFSSIWKEKDNTLQGTIARIKYFLDNPEKDYINWFHIDYNKYL